jgi:hypothetical protein
MSDIEEIAKQPGYDSAASGASVKTIGVFVATFVYMVFFSGVSPGLFGGAAFLVVGIFVVSIVIAMPLFLLKSKFPKVAFLASIIDIAVTIFLTRFVYLWIFAQSATASALDSPIPEVQFKPRSFVCEQPLPEFTLSATSDPTDAQLAELCACIYSGLGEDDKEISQAIVEERRSDVTPAEVQQFIPKLGAELQRCGGNKL